MSNAAFQIAFWSVFLVYQLAKFAGVDFGNEVSIFAIVALSINLGWQSRRLAETI